MPARRATSMTLTSRYGDELSISPRQSSSFCRVACPRRPATRPSTVRTCPVMPSAYRRGTGARFGACKWGDTVRIGDGSARRERADAGGGRGAGVRAGAGGEAAGRPPAGRTRSPGRARPRRCGHRADRERARSGRTGEGRRGGEGGGGEGDGHAGRLRVAIIGLHGPENAVSVRYGGGCVRRRRGRHAEHGRRGAGRAPGTSRTGARIGRNDGLRSGVWPAETRRVGPRVRNNRRGQEESACGPRVRHGSEKLHGAEVEGPRRGGGR